MNRAQRRQIEKTGINPQTGMSEEQQQNFLKNREEFTLQVSIINALTGLRFVGKLKFTEDGVIPGLKLEKIPGDRLKQFQFHNSKRTLQGLAEAGFIKTQFITNSFWQKFSWKIPFFGQKFCKKNFMEWYTQAVIRFGMIYFTFIGDQNGVLVAAVDVRSLQPQEQEILSKKAKVQSRAPINPAGETKTNDVQK